MIFTFNETHSQYLICNSVIYVFYDIIKQLCSNNKLTHCQQLFSNPHSKRKPWKQNDILPTMI